MLTGGERVIHEWHELSAESRAVGGLDRHKQGCLCEAPMDGFTAFLTSPPTARLSAWQCFKHFMNTLNEAQFEPCLSKIRPLPA